MLKLILQNGTEMEYNEAIETEEYYNGASRRTLTITASPTAASLDTLSAELTEENLASITLANTDKKAPVENVYTGYVLPLSCGLQQVLTATETPESAAVYEQRLVIKLGRRTYIEQQLALLGL